MIPSATSETYIKCIAIIVAHQTDMFVSDGIHKEVRINPLLDWYEEIMACNDIERLKVYKTLYWK